MNQDNALGRIEVSPRAIAAIAGQTVLESYGVVGMANRNFRDGIAELLRGEGYRRGIEVKFVDDQIYIDLYVIIQYGTRISEVAQTLMSRVKYKVEKALGTRVAQVNVHVQGLRLDDHP